MKAIERAGRAARQAARGPAGRERGRRLPAAAAGAGVPGCGLEEVQRRPGREPGRAHRLLRLRRDLPAAARAGNRPEYRAQEQPGAAEDPDELRARAVPGDRHRRSRPNSGRSRARACPSSSAPSSCCSARGASPTRCRTRSSRSGAFPAQSRPGFPVSQVWSFALLLTVCHRVHRHHVPVRPGRRGRAPADRGRRGRRGGAGLAGAERRRVLARLPARHAPGWCAGATCWSARSSRPSSGRSSRSRAATWSATSCTGPTSCTAPSGWCSAWWPGSTCRPRRPCGRRKWTWCWPSGSGRSRCSPSPNRSESDSDSESESESESADADADAGLRLPAVHAGGAGPAAPAPRPAGDNESAGGNAPASDGRPARDGKAGKAA